MPLSMLSRPVGLRVGRGLCGIVVTAAAVLAGSGPAAADSRLAPLVGAGAGSLPGQYLVVLTGAPGSRAGGTVAAATVERAARAGIGVQRTYRSALLGYSARLDGRQLARVRQDPQVAYVEADRVVRATQTGATWGLDRIDQRPRPLNGTYNPSTTGAGVTAYILDSGIRITHADFGRRAVAGYTAIADGKGSNDCNGHGTHVAGTVGGTRYGVAKAVRLVAVRVLDCAGSGATSTVVAGLDWVVANHTNKPAVANLSLAGPPSPALDSAVRRVIADGVTVTVAAGNTHADACGSSPARVPAAITVGATTNTDRRDTTYSNYGSCVDLFAPGTRVTSTWYTSNTAAAIGTGTSMATPHAAGVAALHLQVRPTASAAQIRAAIVADATRNVLTGIGTGSPNLLLHAPTTAAQQVVRRAGGADRPHPVTLGSAPRQA